MAPRRRPVEEPVAVPVADNTDTDRRRPVEEPVAADDDATTKTQAELRDVRVVMRNKRYYKKHKFAIKVVSSGIIIAVCAVVAAVLSWVVYLATGYTTW